MIMFIDILTFLGLAFRVAWLIIYCTLLSQKSYTKIQINRIIR